MVGARGGGGAVCIRWGKAAIIGDPVANRLDSMRVLAPPSSRLSSVVFGLLALSGLQSNHNPSCGQLFPLCSSSPCGFS